jgi:hypothetical protein
VSRNANLWAAAVWPVVVGLLIALSCSRCASNPGPTPPVPIPTDAGSFDAGDLETQACSSANRVCGTDEAECLRQVVRLRHSYYAELSDADLRCWVDASTPAAMRACGNGSCQ